jgi:hypothetical protein
MDLKEKSPACRGFLSSSSIIAVGRKLFCNRYFFYFVRLSLFWGLTRSSVDYLAGPDGGVEVEPPPLLLPPPEWVPPLH